MSSIFRGKFALILKIITLAIVTAILSLLAQSAVASGEIAIGAFLIVAIVALNFTYFTKISIPLKFFVPGILFFIAFDRQQILVSALAIVTAGATAGFLIWNRHPAKIYMGDAGALFLGVLLATLTVRFEPTAHTQLSSFLIPVLLLAIPILDTSVAVLSRIRRHLSPFQGGQDHLSHRLIRSGLTRKTSAIILWSLSGLFAGASVLLSNTSESFTNYLLIGAGLTWILLFIGFFRTKDC